jgi:hypothetical protein
VGRQRKLLQGSTAINLHSADDILKAIRQGDRDREDRLVIFLSEVPELIRQLGPHFPSHPLDFV